MKKASQSIVKAVALITLFTILTRFAGFFLRIFLSRTIGAEALGMYQLAFSIFAVLLTIVASGLPLTVSKLTSAETGIDSKKNNAKIVSGALLIAFISSVILCLVVLIFRNFLSAILTDENCIKILIVLLPSVVFSGIYSVFRGYFWGKQNYFAVCIVELFEQVARIGICVLMLIGTFSVLDKAISAGASLSIACALSMILVAIMYFKSGGRLGKPTIKKIVKSAAPVTGVRIAGSLVQPLIAIIIPIQLVASGYTTSSALSMLGIATGMTLPLLFIPSTLVSSLSMALIPDISQANSLGKNEHIISRVQSSLNFCIFVSLFFVPIFIGAGETIGKFFFGNIQSGILLSSFAWIMVPMGITNITSAFLNALGLETKSFKNYVLGSLILILCIWLLPKYIGIKSLGYGMGLCMILTSVLNISLLKRKTNSNYIIFKPLIIMGLLVVPSAAITSFTCGLLSNFFTDFFTLAISCSLGAIFYVVLCQIFKIVSFDTYFIKFKQKANSIKETYKKIKKRRKQKLVPNV
ncbi:MAG: oligosaccharide flippase family protein [Clostridia bacterium]